MLLPERVALQPQIHVPEDPFDAEFGDFRDDLLIEVAAMTDSGDPARVIDAPWSPHHIV